MTKLQQQSMVFQTLGVLILWVGWYGFNGVSTLAIAGQGGVAAHVMMTTTISAASACLATTGIGYLVEHAIDPCYANNGILAGLVAITAGCSVVSLWGAMATGLLAAPVYFTASKLLVYFHVDDVVDAFPVHGACGAWGVLAASLFAQEFYYKRSYSDDDDRAEDCQGVFYGGDGGAVSAAVLFILFVVFWVGSTIGSLFLLLKYTIGVRVSKEVEELGMDDSKHGGHVDLLPAEPHKVTARLVEALPASTPPSVIRHRHLGQDGGAELRPGDKTGDRGDRWDHGDRGHSGEKSDHGDHKI
ncbi:ammonium transporter family-domain-containing protein [Pelagophyceae sp. CCMP2097]|nr:ammonium transporter family-domain-containing protein [Pelagophyceae sp. CCMP2097]